MMTTELKLDPDLAAVVAAARQLAEETGELPRVPCPVPKSVFPADVADAIHTWLWDGGYDEAVARIAAEDPDLADQ
jgi:hypothetical protein